MIRRLDQEISFTYFFRLISCILLVTCFNVKITLAQEWQSKFVKIKKDGHLQYIADQKGNTIPDFSHVGYHQNQKTIPQVQVVATLSATGENDEVKIQQAINELAKKQTDANGIRGAILLKKGTYKIPGSLKISSSGIVLRGEGEETKLIATGIGKRKTIMASGEGKLIEIAGTRVKITDHYVPVGTKSLNLTSAKGLAIGDKIVVYRPATTNWIHDLKMDQIDPGTGTIQWTPEDYNFEFERIITAINGNQITIDNPIVMAMEDQYGGGEIYKCAFDGRISEVGIENLLLESEYNGDTDEEHGWDAISFNKIENSWVSNVTSRYFGYSCVNLSHDSKQITVKDSKCLAPKSQIIGGRRYSFNNDGQLNLFENCYASEGRHDYVTGAKVCGPNVFYNCKSENAKADIGPHHRWAMGTLYDNITTDGEINIQDRGNWGTGHGWSGVNQVLWNCTASKVTVQNPYVSGLNYAIGVHAEKAEGRLKGRPIGVWENQNKEGLKPSSLYLKQVEESKN
ncbi:hypothetical protein DF947_03740 [Pedobacter paludis]|uniref:Pectate lyase superfamily protein domain-containing protein n=1 Tax=Pedobacter paludis TaxID=2203212 RepID=A0A317F580_9SPHI|nr:hypothetical protein DF947_03740 [Pedobacter paludis]